MATPCALQELVVGQIWLKEYPIRYAGARFNARMTIIRQQRGGLLIHSPCPFDDELATEVAQLGPVEAIIAPGAPSVLGRAAHVELTRAHP